MAALGTRILADIYDGDTVTMHNRCVSMPSNITAADYADYVSTVRWMVDEGIALHDEWTWDVWLSPVGLSMLAAASGVAR